MTSSWMSALLWGIAAGSSLLLGHGVARSTSPSRTVLGASLACASGLLISMLSFDLIQHAYQHGGAGSTVGGFMAGVLVYSLLNRAMSRKSAKPRQQQEQVPRETAEHTGSGGAVAIGVVLDSLPEALIIGLSLLEKSQQHLAVVAAVFLANFAESLSGTVRMQESHDRPQNMLGLWSGIVVLTGVTAAVGYTTLHHLSSQVHSIATAVAAGAVLALLVETVVPEAFDGTYDLAGVYAAAGFLGGFFLFEWVA